MGREFIEFRNIFSLISYPVAITILKTRRINSEIIG